ncbi:MAG: hypothetical protein J2P57_07255, partial [Acidimicrobiaceae bacterium]|nr:hypothetical protein [Acidimicrobiaceae bacterium]
MTLFLALGEAQLAAGKLVDARVNLDRLLLRGELSSQERGRALSMLAQAFYLSGDAETARSVFQHAIAHLEEHAVPAAIDALLHQCFNDAFTEGPAVAVALADRAQALATVHDHETRRRAQALAAAVRVLAGDAADYDTLALASHAVEVQPFALASDALSWTGVTFTYGGAAVLCEDFDEAQRVFSIALVTAEEAGAATSIVGLGAQKAWMFTRLGRLSEALDLFAASAGLIDVVPFAEGYVLVGQAYVLLLMGKLDESEALCQRAESAGARRGQTNALIFLHEVRGHRALREGRTFDAADQYAALEELVHRTGLREPCLATWARHAVSAHLSCNREPEAQRLVQWLEGCSK